MTNRTRGPGRRAAGTGAVLAITTLLVFAALAPPERCPAVTVAALRSSARETVDWFTRNQEPDGTWLYQYDARNDVVADEYNVVRHAGVTMGLYLAASESISGALMSADRGLQWALDRLLARDGWAAVRALGQTSTGATALLLAGLAERRGFTGDDRYDDEMRRLGGFLVAQTEPTGAVLASYDSGARQPVPGEYSKYYTGEAYWAIARLHRLFPDDDWGAVADRIGGYLATDRDEREGYWPPIPDHWAAYGLAETIHFDDRPTTRPLTTDEVAYARRQAELFGAQVRWVSQRFGPWGKLVRSPHVPRGGGYGVVGEALTGLWRVAGADPRLAGLHDDIGERAECIAGLAIRAQSDAAEARGFADPDRVRGAWLRDGSTRMDDQQHALAALLRTTAIVESRTGSSGDTESKPASKQAASFWLWLLALLAAFNPARAALGVPADQRLRARSRRIAGLGGVVGGLLAALVALLFQPLAGGLDVSDPALRLAVGVVVGVAGIVLLLRRPQPAEPALAGWRAALVPVAVPCVANAALLFGAVGAVADRGLPVVALAGTVGTLALIALVAVSPVAITRAADGIGSRLLTWGAQLISALLVLAGTLLVIDGVFSV